MQRAEVVAGWVRSENVSALMTWLSFFVDYAYDESDWQAVGGSLAGNRCRQRVRLIRLPAGGGPAFDRLARTDGIPLVRRLR